jgi:hypothetical protein
MVVGEDFILSGGSFSAPTALYVDGDWTDTSSSGFNNAYGTVIFSGVGEQILTGVSASNYFNNVTVEAGSVCAMAGMMLKGDLEVGGTVTVASGQLSITGNLSVKSGGVLSGAGAVNLIADDNMSPVSNSGTISVSQFIYMVYPNSEKVPITPTNYGGSLIIMMSSNSGTGSGIVMLSSNENLNVTGTFVLYTDSVELDLTVDLSQTILGAAYTGEITVGGVLFAGTDSGATGHSFRNAWFKKSHTQYR